MPAADQPETTIRQRAADLGIDGIGFCDAAPLEGVAASIGQAIRSGYIPPDIVPGADTIERLTTPARHLRGARSVICAYQAYSAPPGGRRGPADHTVGTIAYYTASNYYEDLKSRLLRLGSFIGDRFGCRTKAFSCYVTLAEKPMARKAGLGFYGKHGVIVTPRHGSFVVLGEILTDLVLEPDRPLELDCGECTRCIDACPTGAIRAPYLVDRNLCIQSLSGRRRGMTAAIRALWGSRLYGCTDCQDACPYNVRARRVDRVVDFGRVGDRAPVSEMMLLDEGEFVKRFSQNQIGRRERNVIRRNAVIAAGNSRSADFEPALAICAADPDPMIRRHALWATWMIRGREAAGLLGRALAEETDPEVAGEVKSLLDAIGSLE